MILHDDHEEEVRINLKDLIAPPFHDVHKAIKTRTHSDFWLKGGRGSTKSSFAAIEIIKGIMEDENANGIVLRKINDTIRTSVFETLLWAIDLLGVTELWDQNVSPCQLRYRPTGQRIVFRGLDKAQKLKSIKLRKGYFKFLWFEELEEFAGMKEIRSVRQSVLRGAPRGKGYVTFYTYNPPIDPQAWVNTEVSVKGKGKYIHESTYLDVPAEWLGEQFISDAEDLKAENPLLYEHEYMGVATGIHDAIIFAGKYYIEEFEPEASWDGPYLGADFGFANDPSTLVKCWVNGRDLYIEYALFGKHIELDDYAEFYSKVPDSRNHKISADSSQPATISHIKARNFLIEGAVKWPNSVEDGIKVLKGFQRIVIHKRNTEMIQEARLYSYKIDRLTKDVTTQIVDKFNHGWDAVRYALHKFIRHKGKGRFSL